MQRRCGLPGVGAEPGQPPDVSQQREPEASGKGHVHLGCATRFKVPQRRSGGSFFSVPSCSDQTRVHRQVWAPPKEGPSPKEAYVPHETGFGKLVYDKWLREPRRRLRGGWWGW